MKREVVNIMGMILHQWTNGGCVAKFAVNEKESWATLYDIESTNQGKGEATELLREAKKFYEDKELEFGGSVALNEKIRGIYKKLGIKEYN